MTRTATIPILSALLLSAACLRYWLDSSNVETFHEDTEADRRLALSPFERELIMKLVFAECVGLHYERCKTIVDAAHAANPAAFGDVPFVTYDVRTARDHLQGSDADAALEALIAGASNVTADGEAVEFDPNVLLTVDGGDYYMVGLRTDITETFVEGVTGDGVVTYPYKWCPRWEECFDIGPWDCLAEDRAPLASAYRNVEQCCDVIRADVPWADVHGNHIDCYPSYPYGSPSNKLDYGRVVMHVSGADGKVVHPPVNG